MPTYADVSTPQSEEQRIMTEFLRRRRRERMYYLVLIGGMFALWGLLLLGAINDWFGGQIVCAFQIAVIVLAGLVFWLSWRNWRCPACDSWLGGWTFHVNAVISPETLKCPQCGARLL
jgi:hypothetical protein